MLLAIGIAVLWVVQQNRIYQADAQTIAGAAIPIGHLAGTVDQYFPALASAATAWFKSDT